ncbi:MAG: hypothetical protein N2645_03830 [Clostridia bacterium]|nr:hypothetical protein [Clostridia bacterium]
MLYARLFIQYTKCITSAQYMVVKVQMSNIMTSLMFGNAYIEYFGAAEPQFRCGVSHLSGTTEPPTFFIIH